MNDHITTVATPTRPARTRPALTVLTVGLVLQLAALAAPLVDRAAGLALADHLADAYPDYDQGELDSAVTGWVSLLVTVSALGVLGWLTAIYATWRGRRWARGASTALFVVGTVLALTALLTPDESGEVGLAPELGVIGVLPCAAGAIAVWQLWRRRPAGG